MARGLAGARMNIFGVGIPEILVVLLLAAVIFGPGRLPEFAGQFGRAIRELREYARDFRDEYLTDFEEMREEYIEVRHHLEETDQDIRRDLEEAEADIRAAARDAEEATADAISTARDGGTPAPPGRRRHRSQRRPLSRVRLRPSSDGCGGGRSCGGATSARPKRLRRPRGPPT